MNLDKPREIMSTEVKDKLTPEEAKKLLDLAHILHSAYIAEESRSLPEIESGTTIAGMFKKELNDNDKLPGLELRREVSARVEKWKKGLDNGAYTLDEIGEYVRDEIESNAKLYFDGSKHIQMYNRQYVEDKLENYIDEVVGVEDVSVEDLYKIAKIAFDLNGLKTLNDAAGHEAGNRVLEIFSKILKDGKTTKWLKEQNIEVIPAHQSGDEFILLMYGDKDLSPIIEEIKRRYDDEVKAFDASELLDLPTAKKYLKGLNIYDKFLNELSKKTGTQTEKLEEGFSREFKFKLGTSIGIVTLGEALSQITPEEFGDKDYRGIIRAVIGKMFKLADEKAIGHKKRSKSALAEVDPLLAVLYNRNVAGSDKENTEERANLILKNSELESEISTMEAEIDKLKREISLLEANNLAGESQK